MEDSHLSLMPAPLLLWYSRRARSLPWRDDPTPYHVWVSEIMLQQTRVETVIPYYQRFLKELPDVASLASCPEDRLLKLWEGLGYYSRVRNMQKMARILTAEYNGILPDDRDKLLTLPGIGPYTASAIASFAYQKPCAAVDGNLLRIYSRYMQDYRDITKTAIRRDIQKKLEEVMPPDSSSFNQALMDLGSSICIPNGRPHCEECPLLQNCPAAHNDSWSLLPVRPDKKERKTEEWTVLILCDPSSAILEKRPDRGLLAGLYGPPMLKGSPCADEISVWTEKLGLRVRSILPLADSRHIFSHIEWHMKAYYIEIFDNHTSTFPWGKNYIKASFEEVRKDYPLPSAYTAYTRYLTGLVVPQALS